ncbi:hypothetical protein [Salinibacter grassmerensis]|uniref:hypothetical protein n=1 Tax=Salinibacter grassmerensis TaxID=3040353 RepID=UPI0021E7B989|nr:hypothetical protein [Salinibacter grassmerensis]
MPRPHPRALFRAIALFATIFLAATLTLVGCDVIGENSGSNVLRVGFTSLAENDAAGEANASASATAKADEPLTIEGSNGTLALDDIRLVVSGIELEDEEEGGGEENDGDEDDDGEDEDGEDDDEEEDDEEEEYEAGPSALDLPLGTGEVAIAGDDDIEAETYSTFEFEVEDFGSDDDDEEDEQRQLRRVLDTLRKAYPEWPPGASMVATGTFTPGDSSTGGSSTRFKVFFNAEIEVERALSPPLRVTADGPARSLTVELDPARWFENDDETVDNLANSDWNDTGKLVELEFENGVAEIETGDDGEED